MLGKKIAKFRWGKRRCDPLRRAPAPRKGGEKSMAMEGFPEMDSAPSGGGEARALSRKKLTCVGAAYF